mmetsp:Transcript_9204/g.29887  ORF Transcript_9204/g.29887 Transcript_9204/m.29887 type:complete len:230 (+) Transcript_9204:1044-1733(+)
MDNPRPVPTMESATRTCLKSSKTRSQADRGMPQPESETSRVKWTPDEVSKVVRTTVTSTVPSSGVNLMAFDSKFDMTCISLVRSAIILAGKSRGVVTFKEMFFAAAVEAWSFRASSKRDAKEKADFERRTFPEDKAEKSRTSSTTAWICVVAVCNVVHTSRTSVGAEAMNSDSVSNEPQMAFKGVRISWDIFPMKLIFDKRSLFSAVTSVCAPTIAKHRSSLDHKMGVP